MLNMNKNLAEQGKNTRFPVNRRDHTTKHPDGYILPKIKKYLKRKTFPIRKLDTDVVERIGGYEAIALVLIKQALKGDIRALELLLDRLEGKVSQKVEAQLKVMRMGDIIVGEDKRLEFDIGEDDTTKDVSDTGETPADFNGV